MRDQLFYCNGDKVGKKLSKAYKREVSEGPPQTSSILSRPVSTPQWRQCRGPMHQNGHLEVTKEVLTLKTAVSKCVVESS